MIAIAATGCGSSPPVTNPDGGGGSACAAGAYRWATEGGGDQGDVVTGATFDADGNLWVTGTFIGSATWGTFQLTSPNTANPTVFVAELDPTGHVLAARALGSGGDSSARIRTAPDGHIWVGGQMNQTLDIDGVHLEDDEDLAAFLVELDPVTGSAVSGINSTMSDDAIVQDLVFDTSGDIYLAGHYNGGMQLGSLLTPGDAVSSQTGVYVAKYVPATGDFAWLDGWAGSDSGTNDGGAASGIALAPGGSLVVTGTISGSLRIGDTVLTGDGDVSAGSFFAKLGASDGSIAWTTQLVPDADGDRDETAAIAVDGSGNAYATGHLQGTPTLQAPGGGSGALAVTSSDGGAGDDVLVAKLAPDGTPLWFQAAGNGYTSRGYDVAVAGATLYVGGGTGQGTAFGTQTLADNAGMFVAAYDLSGAVRSVTGATTTGNANDEAYAIALGSDGLAMGGGFDVDATFGSDTIDGPNEGDAFAAFVCE